MNVIAAIDTRRKNGRRTFSLAPWSKPHAPPRFFASVKVRWLSQIIGNGGYVSRRFSAQSFDPMSAASETTDTTARNTNDGWLRLGSMTRLAAPRGGGSRGTPGA